MRPLPSVVYAQSPMQPTRTSAFFKQPAGSSSVCTPGPLAEVPPLASLPSTQQQPDPVSASSWSQVPAYGSDAPGRHAWHSVGQAHNVPSATHGLRFPASRRYLWDRTHHGQPIYIQPASHAPSIEAAPELLEAALTAHRGGACQQEAQLTLIARLHVGPAHSHGKLVLTPRTSATQALGPFEVLVPCGITSHQPQPDPPATQLNVSKLRQDLRAAVDSRGPSRLSQLLSSSCEVSLHDHGSTAQLRGCLMLPACPLSLTKLATKRILDTHTSRQLAAALPPGAPPEDGFISMDAGRSLVPLAAADAQVYSIPLVGVWLRGVSGVQHPLVTAACIRFAYSSTLPDKAVHDTGAFLVLIYPAEGCGTPDCYEACFHDDQGQLSLLQYRYQGQLLPSSGKSGAGAAGQGGLGAAVRLTLDLDDSVHQAQFLRSPGQHSAAPVESPLDPAHDWAGVGGRASSGMAGPDTAATPAMEGQGAARVVQGRVDAQGGAWFDDSQPPPWRASIQQLDVQALQDVTSQLSGSAADAGAHIGGANSWGGHAASSTHTQQTHRAAGAADSTTSDDHLPHNSRRSARWNSSSAAGSQQGGSPPPVPRSAAAPHPAHVPDSHPPHPTQHSAGRNAAEGAAHHWQQPPRYAAAHADSGSAAACDGVHGNGNDPAPNWPGRVAWQQPGMTQEQHRTSHPVIPPRSSLSTWLVTHQHDATSYRQHLANTAAPVSAAAQPSRPATAQGSSLGGAGAGLREPVQCSSPERRPAAAVDAIKQGISARFPFTPKLSSSLSLKPLYNPLNPRGSLQSTPAQTQPTQHPATHTYASAALLAQHPTYNTNSGLVQGRAKPSVHSSTSQYTHMPDAPGLQQQWHYPQHPGQHPGQHYAPGRPPAPHPAPHPAYQPPAWQLPLGDEAGSSHGQDSWGSRLHAPSHLPAASGYGQAGGSGGLNDGAVHTSQQHVPGNSSSVVRAAAGQVGQTQSLHQPDYQQHSYLDPLQHSTGQHSAGASSDSQLLQQQVLQLQQQVQMLQQQLSSLLGQPSDSAGLMLSHPTALTTLNPALPAPSTCGQLPAPAHALASAAHDQQATDVIHAHLGRASSSSAVPGNLPAAQPQLNPPPADDLQHRPAAGRQVHGGSGSSAGMHGAAPNTQYPHAHTISEPGHQQAPHADDGAALGGAALTRQVSSGHSCDDSSGGGTPQEVGQPGPDSHVQVQVHTGGANVTPTPHRYVPPPAGTVFSTPSTTASITRRELFGSSTSPSPSTCNSCGASISKAGSGIASDDSPAAAEPSRELPRTAAVSMGQQHSSAGVEPDEQMLAAHSLSLLALSSSSSSAGTAPPVAAAAVAEPERATGDVVKTGKLSSTSSVSGQEEVHQGGVAVSHRHSGTANAVPLLAATAGGVEMLGRASSRASHVHSIAGTGSGHLTQGPATDSPASGVSTYVSSAGSTPRLSIKPGQLSGTVQAATYLSAARSDAGDTRVITAPAETAPADVSQPPTALHQLPPPSPSHSVPDEPAVQGDAALRNQSQSHDYSTIIDWRDAAKQEMRCSRPAGWAGRSSVYAGSSSSVYAEPIIRTRVHVLEEEESDSSDSELEQQLMRKYGLRV